ncbi:hypothetical protein H3V53_00345 [Paraburkholderia bengalensis]|uniref:Uncharacterized protein n=1 Tax=Paraburkholderia bengalensis TaxID=2747562 RepID=A0ABU8IJM5_9BURK
MFSGWKGCKRFRILVPLGALHTGKARTSSMGKWPVPQSLTCERFTHPLSGNPLMGAPLLHNAQKGMI